MYMNTKEAKSYFESVLYDIIAEKVRRIGAVSTLFAEADVKLLHESYEPFEIRGVTYADVTGNHFVDWFFKMDDFADIPPNEFPFSLITYDDGNYVCGYFNGDKLNGIVRVDDFSDCYELSFFFVNPAIQHQGVGQYILRWILIRFKGKKIVLYVYKDNDRAIHIYQKYGFEIVETAYGRGYKPDEPHYVMQKDV